MFHLTEAVGETFDVGQLHHAQRVGWRVLRGVAQTLGAGSTLADARRELARLMGAEGLEKHWHPPQLRFGRDTTCPFGAKPSTPAPLAPDDIFFLDLGILVDGYESDVGQTFTVGHDEEMMRCAADAERIHCEGVARWRQTQCSGEALYRWARARAEALGWHLQHDGATGHRVADFPHHRFTRKHLVTCDFSVAPERWIFEVHLQDPAGRFGAFFEDLMGSGNLPSWRT